MSTFDLNFSRASVSSSADDIALPVTAPLLHQLPQLDDVDWGEDAADDAIMIIDPDTLAPLAAPLASVAASSSTGSSIVASAVPPLQDQALTDEQLTQRQWSKLKLRHEAQPQVLNFKL